MFPTLRHGQDLLCFNWAYVFSKPKAGEMVVIRHHGKEIVKRIQKCDGRSIFVMGDNVKESIDSRSFGPLDKSQIIGKIIWP